jgi:hypothetical protein
MGMGGRELPRARTAAYLRQQVSIRLCLVGMIVILASNMLHSFTARGSTLATGVVPQFKVAFTFKFEGQKAKRIHVTGLAVRPVVAGETISAALQDDGHWVKTVHFTRHGATATASVNFVMTHDQMLDVQASDLTRYGRKRDYTLHLDKSDPLRSAPALFNQSCVYPGAYVAPKGREASCPGRTWLIFTHWTLTIGGKQYTVPQQSGRSVTFSYCASQPLTGLYAYFRSGGLTSVPVREDWYYDYKKVDQIADPSLAAHAPEFGLVPAPGTVGFPPGPWQVFVFAGAAAKPLGGASLLLTTSSC